jgi:hypothetical protein
MGKLIERITPQQQAELANSVEYWLRIGRSVEPLDRAQATEAICAMYQAINKERPTVLFFSSPMMCVLAWGALRAMAKDGSQLESQLRSQLGSQLGSQLWSQLGSQLWSQLGSQLGSQTSNYFAGTWWCAWEVFYDFCNKIGVSYGEKERALLTLWLKQSQHCHWWFPYDGIVFASERPRVLEVDNRGRLHGEHGAALEYSDGYALYSWHGARVEKDIVTNPETITVKAIEQERNQEIRRVMTARYGQARYLLDAGAILVHQDKRGKLWRKERTDDTDLVMVEVKNSTPEPDGSIKDYFLRVPPEMKTATEAVAWTFGIEPQRYAPAIET